MWEGSSELWKESDVQLSFLRLQVEQLAKEKGEANESLKEQNESLQNSTWSSVALWIDCKTLLEKVGMRFFLDSVDSAVQGQVGEGKYDCCEGNGDEARLWGSEGAVCG